MEAEFHFPKLECNESSFPKGRRCQCNLPKFKTKFLKDQIKGVLRMGEEKGSG